MPIDTDTQHRVIEVLLKRLSDFKAENLRLRRTQRCLNERFLLKQAGGIIEFLLPACVDHEHGGFNNQVSRAEVDNAKQVYDLTYFSYLMMELFSTRTPSMSWELADIL